MLASRNFRLVFPNRNCLWDQLVAELRPKTSWLPSGIILYKFSISWSSTWLKCLLIFHKSFLLNFLNCGAIFLLTFKLMSQRAFWSFMMGCFISSSVQYLIPVWPDSFCLSLLWYIYPFSGSRSPLFPFSAYFSCSEQSAPGWVKSRIWIFY